MPEKTLLAWIKSLNKPVFTSAGLAAVSGKSASTISQGLSFLRGQGLVSKIYHGVWSEGDILPSPYSVLPYILPKQRAYVSFTSALHLRGIIEQIPQTITVASVAHTREIRTNAGFFLIHRIDPSFFWGFGWNREGGDFLIAEPEKALADCLYISGYKKNSFSHFPEPHFPEKFSFKKVEFYLKKIKNPKIVSYGLKRLETIRKNRGFRQADRFGGFGG